MAELHDDHRDAFDADDGETRQLDPWERYRALNDLLDTYVDMMEIADRRTQLTGGQAFVDCELLLLTAPNRPT